MDPINILKGAAAFVVSTGVGAIVKNAVKATTPEDLKKFSKISVVVGTAVVSSMVADHSTTYVKERIDKTVDAIKKVKPEVPVITDVEPND